MAKRNTRERIITCALSLFAQKGYAGVSVKEIAEAVGIKDASLYKHFAGKRQIFHSILEEMDRRYEAAAAVAGAAPGSFEEAAPVYGKMATEELNKASTALFLYFLHDEYAAGVRRMLTIEQYGHSALAATFYERYIQAPLAFQSGIFELLQKEGKMRAGSPAIAALHFYGPIYLLLCRCDACPEEEEQALKILRQHVEQFTALYMKEEKE
ncbi:MAG: TetR/AcrR family transcriptional regulator [Oscillospiraceae bacterium]